MIENINQQNFQKYGTVLPALNGKEITAAQKMEEGVLRVDSKAIAVMHRYNRSPRYMENIEGIALLCVSLDEIPENYKIFLLDKPVLLKPGVWHNVLALINASSIKSIADGTEIPESSPMVFEYTPLGLNSRVVIDKIHTLFYEEKERGFYFKGESHEFWEMMYVDTGVVNVKLDDKVYRVEQGEALFFGENQFHTQWADDDKAPCFVTVSFHMTFSDSLFLLGRKFALDNELKDMISKILYEKEHTLYDMEDMIICYLKELIIKLVRMEKLEYIMSSQPSGFRIQLENSIVQKAIDYIHRNISKKIAIPDIANSIPVSPTYLSSVFKKYSGLTIVQYMNEYRLEHSKELIRTTGLNLTELSEQLGFSTVHYFSSQFKKRYGISPSDYAKSIRR